VTDANSKPASSKAANSERITLRVQRQDGPDKPQTRRWETFTVEATSNMTVASALRALQRGSAKTSEPSAPVAFESGCLEERCGSCTMRINGRAAKACSTRLLSAARKGTVTLEPLSKFPVERDLIVDRSRSFRALEQVKAYKQVEDQAAALAIAPKTKSLQERVYQLSRCTSCGACLEVCPEYTLGGDFIGAAALNQVRRFNDDATDPAEKKQRLDSVMRPAGVADCGKAQNCVEACPLGVPLVDSIQEVARDTSARMLFGWLLSE
jgi:succinate dehydrogenase / fumarate reductase, iron-sulfur subunit